MIDKKELREYLDQSARDEARERIEHYVDNQIKIHALRGDTTVNIPTMLYTSRQDPNAPTNTDFYPLWRMEHLSEESAAIVRHELIDLYKKNDYSIGIKGLSESYDYACALVIQHLDLTAFKK